jgi:cell division septation protein DedD
MVQGLEPIKNSNQRVSLVSPSENCAVVQWETNTPAATQVLFAELSDEPVTITISEPSFNYPNATPQNNAGNAVHTAILTGIEPGKVYSYRLVSRPHPTAMPTISDPQILIAGPSGGIPTPTVPPAPVIPAPQVDDTEKVPAIPAASPPTAEPVTPTATPTAETSEDEKDATKTVPAAITAANEALGASQEFDVWLTIKEYLSRLMPAKERLSLSSSIRLFERDRYIVPTLFFLGLLFLLQHLVLPALGITLRNPVTYWLLGAVVLTVVSAMFMFYYVTLMGSALFLGLLVWYLLKSVPAEEERAANAQPKLLEIAKTKESRTKRSDKK